MEVTGRRVPVVGAGIGGMASALLLARAGADVVLLERVGEVAAVGAGLLLQANGLAVLGGLGLDEALRADGFLSDGVPVRAADGRVISSLRVPDFGPGLDRMLAVRRSAVHESLLAAVSAEPGIELRLGVGVRAGESFDGDLVVGADG